jgi:hypothetical protein
MFMSRAEIDWKHKCIDLDTGLGRTPYDVDLSRAQSAIDIMDWILHIKAKNWGTPEVIYELISKFEEAYRVAFGRDMRYWICQSPEKKVDWKSVKIPKGGF